MSIKQKSAGMKVGSMQKFTEPKFKHQRKNNCWIL